MTNQEKWKSEFNKEWNCYIGETKDVATEIEKMIERSERMRDAGDHIMICNECGRQLSENEVLIIENSRRQGIDIEDNDIVCFIGKDNCQDTKFQKKIVLYTNGKWRFFCDKCSAQVTDTDDYCYKCGTHFKKTELK